MSARRLSARVGVNLLTWTIVLTVSFPLLWMVITSLKPQSELFQLPPTLLPAHITFEHYRSLLADTPFPQYFMTSMKLAMSTTAVVVAAGTLGAFSLVRFQYPGRERIAALVLFTYLLPSVVLIIPLYLLIVRMGLANTLSSLVLAYTTFALPYALWLLRSFMRGIPADLESAALIDGASRLGAFVDVILPQALPGIISTALFTFILAWNEYLYALVLVSSDDVRPLTTGVMNMLITSFNIEWSLLMAAAVLMSLPLLVIFAFLQSYLTSGFGAGASRDERGVALMAVVVLDKVRKAFGAVVAIPSLDLSVADGEFVSLLGPSGCGKTTTLRMLAGLERPTAGRLLIGDRVVNDVPPGQRDIAMVFQSYALYPHMTVAENIAYPLRKRGVKRRDRPALVRAAADLLQLGALLDRKPRQLSGGQQQRVALGRALVRDPQLFLLDEPLSNLDAKLRAHMRAELIELHRRLGKTMVYVTHDQLEAMTMSTRIAVMFNGELQQFASPAEVYGRPANAFVAGFIGTPSMPLVEGVLAAPAGLRFGGVTVTLPDGHVPEGAQGAVSVGIRPEDVLVGQGPFAARVRVAEPAGHECIFILDAGGAVLTARLPGDTRVAIGETVPFDLRAARLHLFDGASGRRLNTDRTPAARPAALALSA